MPSLQLRDVPSRGPDWTAPGSSAVETEITSVHCSKPPSLRRRITHRQTMNTTGTCYCERASAIVLTFRTSDRVLASPQRPHPSTMPVCPHCEAVRRHHSEPSAHSASSWLPLPRPRLGHSPLLRDHPLVHALSRGARGPYSPDLREPIRHRLVYLHIHRDTLLQRTQPFCH